MCFSVLTFAQNRKISGKVIDTSDNSPIPGVNVIIKGTTTGTQTNFDGEYSIEVPDKNTTLVFSFIGMVSQEIVVGSQATIDINLKEDAKQLSEVVVTAVGIERERKALGYSVESVGGDDLLNAREANIVNSIAGKVSGVQITNSGGQVGASSRIVIRGASSFLGNNQPLFVIDGVPVDNSMTFGGGQNNSNGTGNGDSPLFYGGASNRAMDIDPANIESMSVLKGASATALYGTRAANGVVLITTKSGKKSKGPKVTYGVSVGTSKVRLPEFQNKYGQGLNGQYRSGLETGTKGSTSWGPRMDTLRVDSNGEYDPNGQLAPIYNNREDFYRTGSSLDNSISIAGGGNNASYFLSYSNKNEKGIEISNDLNRHNLLAKFTTNLSDKLEMTTSVNYIKTDLNSNVGGNGRASNLWTVYGSPISYNLQGDNPNDYLNADGTQRLYRTNRNSPYFLVDNNGTESQVNRYLVNISGKYKINDWLSISNRFGTDTYTETRDYVEVKGTHGSFPDGRYYQDINTYKQLNNDFMIQASKRFGDFGVDGLIGTQVNDIMSNRLFTQGVDLSIKGYNNIANGANVTSVQYFSQRRLIGLYAQGNVDYKNIAFLTVTARNDWSSTLPKDSNSFFYPSVSGSFVFSDALSFLEDNPVLTFGKVRLGWASIGNDTSPYNTQETVFSQSNVGDGLRGSILFPYQGQNGFTISNAVGNPNLTPEKTSEIEMGLEFELWEGRIRFEGSYYNRLSKNQIMNAPVAASSGSVSRIVNAGSLRNKGIELMVNTTPVDYKGFKWELGFTYSKNENIVEELTDGVDNIRLAGFTSPGIYIVKDQGYGVIWGSRYLRNDAGQVIINDDPNSNRYGLPVGTEADLGVIGKTIPDFIAGIRNTFRYSHENYGNFSLGAVVDIREGGDILNLDNFYLNFYGVTKMSEDRSGENTIVVDGVLSDGSTANTIEVPLDENYWRNNWGLAQEEWVEDGSYVRLREVTFTYGVPSKLLQNTFIETVNLSVTGRNLLLYMPNFTGSDPETSLYGSANGQGFYNFITPATKGWTVGLNVGF